MLLLKEIQNAATNSNMPIADLLRKCRILAFHLKHEEFKTWVDHELNGYLSRDSLPDYRVLDIESVGTFVGGFGSALNNAPIPSLAIPEQYRHSIEKHYVEGPISSIESLIDSEGSLRGAWPANLIATVGNEIYSGMSCIGAWKVMSKGQFIAIIDTVRTRILQFALEIEAQIPGTEDTSLDSFSLPQEGVSHVFNTYIMGNARNFQMQQGTYQSAQHQQQYNSPETFFSELKQFIQQTELSDKIKTSLVKDVNALQSGSLDEIEAASRTKNILQHAPSLREKFESFVLGVGSSLTATGVWEHSDKIIAGIKFALSTLGNSS